MYRVSIITKEDLIKHQKPMLYENIRTISLTTGRVLLTDYKDRLINIRPDIITNITINPVLFTESEEVFINE